jgi:hypothetical protein
MWKSQECWLLSLTAEPFVLPFLLWWGCPSTADHQHTLLRGYYGNWNQAACFLVFLPSKALLGSWSTNLTSCLPFSVTPIFHSPLKLKRDGFCSASFAHSQRWSHSRITQRFFLKYHIMEDISNICTSLSKKHSPHHCKDSMKYLKVLCKLGKKNKIYLLKIMWF